MLNRERSTRSSKRLAIQSAPDHELQSTHTDTGQYMCIECSETFDSKLELTSHRQSHEIKKQFTCAHCGRGFHHQVFLEMHERSHEVGSSRSSLSKTSTGRVMSTRSSKALANADIIHVTPAPKKSVYHLNSKVQFKREQNANQCVAPRECVTRRTLGTFPDDPRSDLCDENTQFELRISKLSDSTIHLIDPYGNTIEILAEVFNTYAIGEPEEESVSPTDDLKISEISAAPTSSTVHLDQAEETGLAVSPQDLEVQTSAQAEVSKTCEPTKASVIEEDVPLCHTQSVSSTSISPKTLPDLSDDAEDVLSTQTPCESDVMDVTSNEHLNQPATETPKISTEEEILPSIVKDSLITCDDEMVTEDPIGGDVSICNNELAVVTNEIEPPSLKIGALDDPSSEQLDYSEVLSSCLNNEDRSSLSKPESPEPLLNINNLEKDDDSSRTSTGNEKDPSLNVSTSISEVDLSLDVNKDNSQLVSSFVKDGEDLNSDVVEDPMLLLKTGLGGTDFDKGEQLCEAEVPLPHPDKSVALLEDDRKELQTPLTLNEDVSTFNEHHQENQTVSTTGDSGSLTLDSNLQTDLSTDPPIDNAEVNPKDKSDENQTTSKSELKPGLSETDISKLNQGAHDKALHPVDICSSNPNSENITNLVISQDVPDQGSVGLSDHEGDSLKRDLAEKVLFSLETQVSEPIIVPDKIPDIASDTVPILQEELSPPEHSQELLGVDSVTEYMNTDIDFIDSSQKNDGSCETNLGHDVDMSSPVHKIQAQQSSNEQQDVKVSEKKLEVNISSDLRHIDFSENEEKSGKPILDEAPVVTPAEVFTYANVEHSIEEALSQENFQTSVNVAKCDDLEKIQKDFQTIPQKSGEDNTICDLLPEVVIAGDGLLLPCDEDLTLKNSTENQDVGFSVQTLINITSACVEAQEHVLSQESKAPEQDATGGMMDDEKLRSTSSLVSSDLKDDLLLNKLGEDSGTTLCLLEPTLALSPDLEDLSEKCLLSNDSLKDLPDIDKTIANETPHKQYIEMSNANLTENDLADDFVDPGSILLDVPSLDETTKEQDLSAVSVEEESTVHDLSDLLSPEIQESEYTDGLDEKNVGVGGQCLKCGRKVRRGRKELVWFPICYKCRLKTKREQRQSSDGTGHTPGLDRKKGSSDFSNIHIKQETDPALDDAFCRTDKSVQESSSLLKKMYKCPKCEKSFRIAALLAGHMKCHALPQCLGCGCAMTLKYKTKRIPKRCHKCFQKLKQQKKEERALHGDNDEDNSLDSDSESLFADDADLQSLTDDIEPGNDPNLSSTKRVEDSKAGDVKRGIEPFHSKFMRKNKKMNPAIQALYCTCDIVPKSGAKQPKICKNCQKPVRDRLVHGSTAGGKVTQLKTKKTKLPSSEPGKQNLPLGESSVSHDNELSPDEFCKEEVDSLTELEISDQMSTADGENPRLCPQCGKIFKCNRSMNLHLLSHSATQCESCGCRLQKKKRAGRWAKKCRVCRLLTKDKGLLEDSSIEEVLRSEKIGKEKNVSSLHQKMKSKMVRSQKIQSIAKRKKELKWMNMILAVKGLTRKPRKKKEPSKNSSSEEKLGSSSEAATSSGTEDKASIKELATLPKCASGSSDLQVSQKKMLGGVQKANKKCIYKEKNIIKLEEQQMSSYMDDSTNTQVSVKEEEENQCLECNKIFPSFDLLLSHQQDHIEGEPLTCPQCPQRFSTEQYLNIHSSMHVEGPPFRCLECNKTFTRRNHLGVHKRVHTGARPYACPDCPCRFRQKGSLIIHRYTHRNLQLMQLKPYQCSTCNKSFKQKERLVIHERLHTGECPYSCKDCDEMFHSKSRLYIHRKIHRSPGLLSSLDQESGGQPYQCKDCGKVCSTKASFVLHSKVHRSSAILDQSQKEKLETTDETKLSTEQDLCIKTEGNPFICKDCNKVCSTKASFVLHRKVHSPDNSPPFICKACGKVFSTKASFVLHRKVHKSTLMLGLKANLGDPPYTCQDCNKVCSTKASFVLHRKVHRPSGEKILKTNMEPKSFVCKVCGFVSSTKASFVLHKKIHRSPASLAQNLKNENGEHSFTCKDCNKVCSTKASLVLHGKVHKALPSGDQSLISQAEIEEKPYHCKDCGKLYSTKGRLLTHMKLHSNGDESADAEQQRRLDIEDKEFACPICNMKFTRMKILVRHKLIHGEDVFRCIHCGKRFLFQKSLINHLQVCLKKGKKKSLLGKEKVVKKRKIKDESNSEQSAPKKRKYETKKAGTAVQKVKNKKIVKAKKLVINKEKSKPKGGPEKKPKKTKGEAEQNPEAENEKQNEQKQEKSLETVSKEKEVGKEKKSKEVSKAKKVLKKVPPKQKRQKVSTESLKKWKIIAAATVKKRKIQAAISGGKKKITVKKKAPSKTKAGGKNSKE